MLEWEPFITKKEGGEIKRQIIIIYYSKLQCLASKLSLIKGGWPCLPPLQMFIKEKLVCGVRDMLLLHRLKTWSHSIGKSLYGRIPCLPLKILLDIYILSVETHLDKQLAKGKKVSIMYCQNNQEVHHCSSWPWSPWFWAACSSGFCTSHPMSQLGWHHRVLMAFKRADGEEAHIILWTCNKVLSVHAIIVEMTGNIQPTALTTGFMHNQRRH